MKMNRFASVIAVVAATALLAGTGGAVAGGLITSRKIQDNTIRSQDVKNGTLKTRDLSAEAQSDLTGRQGPAGPAGPRGARGLKGDQGVPGVQGSPGISGFHKVIGAPSTSVEADPAVHEFLADASATCPPGETALSGGYTVTGSLIVGPDQVNASLVQADETMGDTYHVAIYTHRSITVTPYANCALVQ